jgi:hypothetical protein
MVYLGKAIQKLKLLRENLSVELLTHISTLGWEHIKGVAPLADTEDRTKGCRRY